MNHTHAEKCESMCQTELDRGGHEGSSSDLNNKELMRNYHVRCEKR